MIDFALKLPRVTKLALALAEATGDITEPRKALLDAAIEDIPKLGWDVPRDMLLMIQRVQRAREVRSDLMSFTKEGAGPFCIHQAMPMFCTVCDYDADDELRNALVGLAKAA